MNLVDCDQIVGVIDRGRFAWRDAPLLVGRSERQALEVYFLMIWMNQKRSGSLGGSLWLRCCEIEAETRGGVGRRAADLVDLLAGDLDECRPRFGIDRRSFEIEIGHPGGIRRSQRQGSVLLIP